MAVQETLTPLLGARAIQRTGIVEMQRRIRNFPEENSSGVRTIARTGNYT